MSAAAVSPGTARRLNRMLVEVLQERLQSGIGQQLLSGARSRRNQQHQYSGASADRLGLNDFGAGIWRQPVEPKRMLQAT
ncbi:Uncharacterised protein [Mycobacteroides abscessus subsp. abscessus]|nr:Uncharacterised protein [Mycobacteroides abscessus subsp. abscessus]